MQQLKAGCSGWHRLYQRSMKTIRPILLLIASVSFGLGIVLPLVRLEKLWIFSETPSLVSIVLDLWHDGEALLAVIVATFSIAFPLIKMFSVYQAAFAGKIPKGWTSTLAKWSMMDVMLVAIAIFAAKTSGLANAFTQPGLWFFALSTIAISACIAWPCEANSKFSSMQNGAHAPR